MAKNRRFDPSRAEHQPPSARQGREISVTAASFTGPIPPPEMLASYNQVFPGCAERIVAMAEQQSQHRRTLEHAVVDGNIQAEKRGQWLAFILGAIAIIGGVGLITIER